jgi:hypothetical protein
MLSLSCCEWTNKPHAVAHLAGGQVEVVHVDAGELVQSARIAVDAQLSMR